MKEAEDVNYSEEEAGHEEKFVPIVESIRYRKRAQCAEKKASELESELGRVSGEREELAGQVTALKQENAIVQKLARAGATDMEAAVLIAKARVGEGGEIDKVVEKMKAEKPHLFGTTANPAAAKTAGAKERSAGAGSALERAARAALKGGTRAHVQEYLRIRRNYV